MKNRLAPMRNIIAGTAGHIDHGKSALVRALTGQETDRLKEEKRRGISIDIGFAHLELPGVRLGFVDVPGHERFVKNMLAGASGIDLVLLVIAADESIKPQTREHFDICRLLGIRARAIVITKADLVDPDLIELVKLEAEDLVRGSFLEGAPVCAVSSLTGAGLEQLKSVLADLAARTPEKDASRDFRLPVDRSFSMKGFGTVVTGTLQTGTVRIDDELESHQVRLNSQRCSGAAQITAAVHEFHRQQPLQPGAKKEELRSRYLPDSPPFLLETLLARCGDLTVEGDLVRLRSHRVALREDEEKAAASMEALFRDAGLTVPATAEVLARSGVDPARARTLLQMLLKQRRLVRVGEELVYHQTAIAKLRELLAARKGQRFGVPEFKDWTGISRKYAIPLLEFLDRERVTRRDGEQRVVL